MSRQEKEADEKQKKVRSLAADGNYAAPPQHEAMDRKNSRSLHSESTDEEKNHVIKVLEHESKLYNFEKNFLKMMSQNQPQAAQLPK